MHGVWQFQGGTARLSLKMAFFKYFSLGLFHEGIFKTREIGKVVRICLMVVNRKKKHVKSNKQLLDLSTPRLICQMQQGLANKYDIN